MTLLCPFYVWYYLYGSKNVKEGLKQEGNIAHLAMKKSTNNTRCGWYPQ